jgi:hypothetical protein
MDVVCEGIRAGDLACAEIGVEMIEEDGGFAFGRARNPGQPVLWGTAR